MLIGLRTHRAVTAGVVAALLSTGFLAGTAGQAEAVVPVCVKAASVSWGAGHGPVPSTSGGSLNCRLGPGNSGAGVKALQAALKLCHKKNIAVDGVYGDRTKSALAAVQRNSGIDDDGLYGPQTRNVILWDVTEKTPAGGTWKYCDRL
ncbi:peptidoglycan-binding protein [Streptomyces sp. WAC05374]|uniref:peptidoglycan-binding domain-containing protein n=1 Tax=Streptomyces sp. WAC05374 TaxID=2487420 RepID=UPI000F87CC48|nr:peptidoglycan-binding domain-containing protein [Streptomyces sp. WAC05374]RST19607.1 peptidoglycan-binding protein [Streptomyces sp. WAC05374]TDF50056.1 peptidoglycan-binding protein [Streptomyces sp. WAC05374]TDF57782.1 peptidoglycan-binding protein [Streptomyces sp. WAC05374]TDF60310.1 peptidoglycan-binding protein [Streptomyces sp. WAC05374]